MKKIWLIFQILLFSILTGAYFTGAEDLFTVALTILILESLPLNMLFGWIFFAYADLSAYPSLLFAFALVMSFLSYIQWFELVPRIVRYFKTPFAEHDREINLVVEKKEPKLLTDPAEDWAVNFATADQNSPVDRFLNNDRD